MPCRGISRSGQIQSGYGKIYRDRYHDAVQGQFVSKLGFFTSKQTRELLLNQLASVVDAEWFVVWDQRLQAEINGFAFDAEAVFLAHCLDLRIQKVPVTLVNEYASTISLSRNAIPMLLDVMRVRWRALRGEYDLKVEPVATDESLPTTRAAA